MNREILVSSNLRLLVALVLLYSSLVYSELIPQVVQDTGASAGQPVKICTPLIHKMNLYWVMRDVFLQRPTAEVQYRTRQLTTVCRQHSVQPIFRANSKPSVERAADRMKIQIK